MIRFGTVATLMAAASAVVGTATIAQTTTSNAPAQTGMPNTSPPTSDKDQATTPTPAPVPTSFTDSDVNNFAGAAIAVQKIQQDSSVAATDKQTQMASAVSSSGLTPEKFNAIAQASQSDPALMKRIQTAAAAKMQASGGTAAGSAGASGSAGGTDGAATGGMSGSTGQ